MIGTRLGPYRLERELGAGGMGSVYLASVVEDAPGVTTGSRVAVKVVHPHLLERGGFFKRFQREAEIGRSVRHGNVVRTLDVDALSVDGRLINFMVMEYVEGRTLRGLLEDLKTVPETLLREVARQVAAGLAAIHGAGIVHRDLKPENVLITADHEVKVMDLGVARLMEESVALTREGQFAGSLLYAAPEQFGGREVGAAADLYSVGVMLYELAAGENPFQREGAPAVITAHLKDVPRRLSDRNSEVSPFFSEVVGTLLRKDPAERVESSTALLTLLEEGETSAWWGERERHLLKTEGHLPKIPVRRETTLHGRAGSLALLRDLWEKARGGKGSTVLLEGEAGIGKTRVVDAFLQGLKGQEAHVLYGAYPPSGGLGGLTDALTGKFGGAGMEEALTPYLTVTPRLVPGFAAMVQHQAPPEGAEPLTVDAIHAVFVHLMRALAAEKPLLWIVDDLQFAPPESRKVVLALARAVEGHRVLVVTTARPGLPEEEMANFSRLGTFQRAALGRLSPREVMELLRDALRSTALAERLGGKIAIRSDGVPYYVFEIIRALREGDLIRQRPDGTYFETQVVSDIEVPASIRDLIEARLRGLSESQRAILDAGAVQGVEFDPGLVAAVLEEKKVRVLRDLAEMERRTGVVRGGSGGCQFDQNQIQEVLYRSLLADLRSEYHAMLADAFAEREGVAGTDPKDLPGPAVVFLARHHLRGSRPREGVAFLLPAVDHLRKACRDEEALDLVMRALGVAGLLAGRHRMEALLRAGPLLRDAGKPAQGTTALEEAVALADGTGEPLPRARARSALAEHSQHIGRSAAALEMVEAALPLAREGGGGAHERRLDGVAGLCLLGLGRLAEARARLERILPLAREAGDLTAEGAVVGNLGGVLGLLGHHTEARARWEEGLAIARRIGHRRHEAVQTGNLGEDDRAAGSYAAARDRYVAAQRLCRELGLRDNEAVAQHNLGETLTVLGDPAAAQDRLEAAGALTAEIGYRHLFGYTLRARADLALAAGDGAAAAATYGEALALARELKAAPIEAEALVGLGRLRALGGRTAEAAPGLAEALDIARRVDSPNDIALATCIAAALPGGDPAAAAAVLAGLGDRPWHVARMESRWWLWKGSGDGAHLAEAKRLLDHLVAHAPEECRGPMLERVPLHRDIVAAAGAEAGVR